jgi:uncharacterized coiled-coil DUF342 family protein
MLNPRRIEEREKKKVCIIVPKEEEQISNSIPVPLPRSTSMAGLSTITKSISKQQEQVDELTSIIDHLKEIINKYENEIKELKNDNLQRDKLIKQYEDKYNDIEKAINDIWNS